MRVLGIHSVSTLGESDDMSSSPWDFHDAAAVLVDDGRVVAAAEEERLNRVKHSSAFPARAIRLCLEQGGVGLEQVDHVAVGFSEGMLDHYAVQYGLEDARLPMVSGRAQVAALFEREFGIDVSHRLRFVNHHLAHLRSALGPSGFPSGLAVSLDGAGDSVSGTVAVFRDERLEILREFPIKHSLGLFYQECLAMVGYTRFDEYKVMGLAPYGDPERYAELFAQAYSLLPEGQYGVVRGQRLVRLMDTAGLTRQARRKGEPFTQPHCDFAAALQQSLERIVLHVLSHFREATGERSLCLAGGVAHNCALNGRIAYSGLFDRVWVQPAAHDAGNALGAALAVLHEEGAAPAPGTFRHVYLGRGIPDGGGVERLLRRWEGLATFERCGSVAEETARLLAAGMVVGWVQGRSEFGPRALGNRSILADPRPAENKNRINAMVKKREGYRPFAPSVLEEEAADYFELPGRTAEYPFMTFALRVREEMRPVLGAVTHVDGTARVQTVSRETNPRYWSLLRAFGQLTGIPMLLNTSFNNNAEPIVDSVDEAVSCFLTTGLDALVVDDYLVRKVEQGAGGPGLLALSPSVPVTHKLVMRSRRDGARTYSVEACANRFHGDKEVAVTGDAYRILAAADGSRTLDELAVECGITGAERMRRLVAEMAELWSRRVVGLLPAPEQRGPGESAARLRPEPVVVSPPLPA